MTHNKLHIRRKEQLIHNNIVCNPDNGDNRPIYGYQETKEQ